jgi:hypothetical protein
MMHLYIKNKFFFQKYQYKKNLITCDDIDATDNIKINNTKHLQILKALSKTTLHHKGKRQNKIHIS